MSRTISGVYTHGIYLSSSDNPVTLDATANITPSSGDYGLYGNGGSGQTWTITNAGVVNVGTGGVGLALGNLGNPTGAATITNQDGGTIEGAFGTDIFSAAATTVTNLTGASIFGSSLDAVYISGSGTVTNSGTIAGATTAAFAGVVLSGGGAVINNAGGTISGFYGVVLDATGTVTNAGTIESAGPGQNAVILSNAASLLVVDPGAVFLGGVDGGSGTLELASASSAGTLTDTNFDNFGGIEFDPGAQWTLIGDDIGLSGVIQGFAIGDTLDLTGFAATEENFANNALVLTDAGNAHSTLSIQGLFSTVDFVFRGDGAGGTEVTRQGGPLLYGDTIDAAGIVATTETVDAGGTLTLLDGINPVGSIVVGTSLSTGDFTLQSDNAGGTDIVVSSVFGTYASGVTLSVDTTTIAAGATIASSANNVIGVYGSASTTWNVTNQGSIDERGAVSYGIDLAGSGTVTNAIGRTIYAQSGGVKLSGSDATVINLGQITAPDYYFTGRGTGIYLTDGGVVINGQSAAAISPASVNGYWYGIRFGSSNAATLTNYGRIDGLPGHTGVQMVNGTIFNGASGATGAILGGGGSGVFFTGVGTVVNFATLGGGGDFGRPLYGIKLDGAGSVSNIGPSSVIYGYIGIYAVANDTITTGGTIRAAYGAQHNNYNGAYGTAIEFTGGTNALIVNPGAVFSGSIKAAGVTTMELTSASSAGTLAGFGTTVTNFSNLVFDPGAAWTVAGNASAAGLGTLAIAGFTINDTIDLTSFVAVSETFANNALVLTDINSAHATLAIQGAFAATDFPFRGDGAGGTVITFEGDPLVYGETVDAAGIVATTGTVDAGGTLTLLDVANPVGTIVVGTSLSTGDFTFQPDLAGGTDVIVSTVFGSYASGVKLVPAVTTIAASAGLSGTANQVTAVYGAAGTPWTVTNQDTIQQTGEATYGISFAGTGTVTNATTGSIQAEASGVAIVGANAAVTNLGSIVGGGPGEPGANSGIYLPNGGAVINGQSGGASGTASVNGYAYGVRVGSSNAGTLTNYGSVTGFPGGTGVRMVTGTVVNGPGGATAALIAAGGSGVIINGAGTVLNHGSITAGGYYGGPEYGVKLGSAGTIANLGPTSLIYGYTGIYAQSNDTVSNAGTIGSFYGTRTNFHGVYGTALQFGGGTNALIVDPGAVFRGSIKAAGVTTMELTSASSAGTLAGFGGTITNFSSLEFDSGAKWTITGDNSNAGLGTLAITGFAGNDTIDLTGFLATTPTYSSGALVLSDALNATETLHLSGGTFTTANFFLHPDSHGGTDIVACYRAGTRIATPTGETAVEQLRIGDLVRTHGGNTSPVKWIGRRAYSAARVAANAQLRPVLIQRGALADGIPHRDLYVSPMHSMFIDEVLIPASALINGVTVRRCDLPAAVEYLHVELDHHAVIFAEGAPSETFIDDDSRKMFDNACEFFAIYGADPAPRNFCAPRIENGLPLEAVRRRLARRAGFPVAAASPGKLLGHVERIENGVLHGWALDDANPGIPVELDVRVDGASLGLLLANHYRTDLDRAGLAGGRCAFSVALQSIGRITAMRASDGFALPVAAELT